MAEIIFKRNMNIGTISAESDQEFLSNCFLTTPEYEELLDFQNKKMIILGRTGSGKTALLNKIKEDVDVYIEIRPDTFAFQYITNVPFVLRLKEEGVNLDIFYKFLWLHEIISQIIKKYFAYNKRNFLEELSRKTSDAGRIHELKKYLQEYEGAFFDEGSTEKITKEIEKNLSGNIGINDIANFKGSLTDSEKKEIQTKASQYINKTQIAQLKNIITLFKEYFSSNKQKKIIVGIDNLDENWMEDSSKYQLIDALLNAIRLFVDISNIKILMAMRADLLAKTCKITKRQNEKDESFTLRLNWSKRMLRDLLDKRIEHLCRYKYQKNIKLSFKDIFNFNIDDVNACDYILDRTMMRPRDAINYVNLCIEDADGQPAIIEENVLSAEKIFRTERLKALQHEWGNIFGDMDAYIEIVYFLGNQFEYNTLKNVSIYQNIEQILYKSPNTISDQFFKTGDDNYKQETNIKELLNILFTIGLIGVKQYKSDSVSFATPNRSVLTACDFTDNLIFEIHPLFAKKENKELAGKKI